MKTYIFSFIYICFDTMQSYYILRFFCTNKKYTQCIRPTKIVHPTYKSCAFGLQKSWIRPKKVVHPTYKSCASDLQNCESDPQKLCIRPSKVVHTTYIICASDQGCSSGLQVQCIQHTVKCAPTYSRSDTLTFFNWVFIRHTVHRTNSSQKLMKNHVWVGPKYRRTDVT